MRNRINLIIGGVLISLLIFQTIRARMLAKRVEVLKVEKIAATDIATETSQELERYVNAYGNEVVRAKQGELTIRSLNELIESERLSFAKQLEGARKNNKNVIGLGSINTSVSLPQPVKADSTIKLDDFQVFDYRLKDEYNNIQAFVLDTPQWEMRVPIYINELKQRKKILWLRIGKWQYEREVSSPNKLVHIDSVFFYSVRK